MRDLCMHHIINVDDFMYRGWSTLNCQITELKTLPTFPGTWCIQGDEKFDCEKFPSYNIICFVSWHHVVKWSVHVSTIQSTRNYSWASSFAWNSSGSLKQACDQRLFTQVHLMTLKPLYFIYRATAWVNQFNKNWLGHFNLSTFQPSGQFNPPVVTIVTIVLQWHFR